MTSQSLSSTDDRTLRVLSFNIWCVFTALARGLKFPKLITSRGLAFIAKERPARIRAVAEHVAAASYDIVCLQECWTYKDYELIKDVVAHKLPYSRFFHSGALGSGLAIFTRYPFSFAQVMPYKLSGTPQQAIAGDFFVNKSAAYVVLEHPILGELEVWTTHMHAGGEHAPDTRQAHRIGEGWQLANAVIAGAARGRYSMVMGDFNAQPQSVPIGMMRLHAGLTDSFLETHPRAASLVPPPASPEIAIHEYGMSCDSSLNSWSAAKNIKAEIQAQGGKRLDYIFYGQPASAGPSRHRNRSHSAGNGDTNGNGYSAMGSNSTGIESRPRLRCVKCEMVLTENVPGKAFSYSDHAGVFATFTIDPASDLDNNTTEASSAANGTAAQRQRTISLDSNTSTKAALLALNHKASRSIDLEDPHSAMLSQARHVLQRYTALSRNEATLHLRLSAAAIVVLLGLTIGSAWQPKSYLQPIFTLVGGLAGAAVVTFFYLGFAWGRWEAGILAEVDAEMSLELTRLERR